MPGMADETRLEEVGDQHAAAYLDMVAEFEMAGEGYPFNDVELARQDFAAFVRDLRAEARGENLPPGIAPQTTYILTRTDGRALGEIRFRAAPVEPVEEGNGHIGYNVRPSERGKGYATRMLALTLERARALGVSRVMLPVEGENRASMRVIERNGGRLTRRFADPESGEVTSIYWVNLD